MKDLIATMVGWTAYDELFVRGTAEDQFEYVSVSFTWSLYERLKAMPYSEFLRTDYWHAVKAHVLIVESCSMCAGHLKLNVHHRTYKHHGREHLHLEDLIVLCENCHAKFHDKLKESDEEAEVAIRRSWHRVN
jgi:hypothetical protein